jgi:hypothetical protein
MHGVGIALNPSSCYLTDRPVAYTSDRLGPSNSALEIARLAYHASKKRTDNTTVSVGAGFAKTVAGSFYPGADGVAMLQVVCGPEKHDEWGWVLCR